MITPVMIWSPKAQTFILVVDVLLWVGPLGQVECIGSTSSMGASRYLPWYYTIVTHLV